MEMTIQMDKNMYSVFGQLEKQYPIEDRIDPVTYHPVYDGISPTTGEYAPPSPADNAQYFNYGKYIEPHASTYFGSSVAAVEALEDPSWVPLNDRRIDPNKIFTPDIQALKTLAANQMKIKLVFEKKLLESLQEKGKYGLTEDDINAMNAVTSAGSAIAGINKAQVDIKAKIADIRLKQQQAAKAQEGGPQQPNGGYSGNVADAGRYVLDHIFDAAVPNEPIVNVPDAEVVTSPAEAAALEDLLPSVGDNIEVENMDAKVYVVVGAEDSSAHFEAYDKDGNVVPDYPLPNAKIESIDRDGETAKDALMREYKVKQVMD